MRGSNIPDDWKRYIMRQAIIESYKPRMLLADEILEQMKQSRDVKDKLPERESIGKIISTTRNHPKSPLDEVWSVGCLAQYDIPPEVLPAVLQFYEKRLREEEQHFTIREALWIGRLYKVIDDPIFLERFASAYALRDKIDWILDNPVYTRDFDAHLLDYCNEDRRLAYMATMHAFPHFLNPFPASTSEEEAEVKEKLERKGHDIKTPGEELLTKHVEQLWLEELPKVLGELKKKWGQKGYAMTPEEESFRNWVEQKWPVALEEFRKRKEQNKKRD